MFSLFLTGDAAECRQVSPPHEGEAEARLVQGHHLTHARSRQVCGCRSWTGQ